ncbi:MAG: peptidylprolyl isomerase [Muribaculaceae bacterium]|nr:peptidylprolyl isomerase [Muribaculaceae bacterium]
MTLTAGAIIGIGLMNAKVRDGIIMTVDGEEVPSYEFVYLFNKNNQQQIQPQTLDEYLQLFEIYRLKVAEAKKQGVDTTSAFIKEMNQYRRELLEPYISDTDYFNSLVEEAVHRDSLLVESSHIMIIRTNDQEKDARNLALLDSLRTELLNGGDFAQLAKTYSQDKFSSEKGGYLGFSPAGTYPYGFETAVYETSEGEISEIVESHVGWHIVKSGQRKLSQEFNRPTRAFELIKTEVERRASSPFDTRYHQLKGRTLDILKSRHPEQKLDGLNEEEIYEALVSAEEQAQYDFNEDYRNLVDEYVNGSLLYAVSVENIWDRASNDKEGLQNYFETHRDKYKWVNPHAKGLLVQALNDSVAKEIKLHVTDMPSDSIAPFIRKNFKKEATVERFNIGEGGNAIIDYLMFGGEAPDLSEKKYQACFVIEGRIAESPENYEDVKSEIVNDYQEALEKEWVESLRKSHKVELNQKELNKIRKTLSKN